MAFVKKTWVDRDSEYPNRRSLTDPTTGTTEIRDIGLAEGDVYVEGTPLKASEWNDLEQRIEDAIDEIPITEVEVTPVVTDGETLATIRVNEDTSDIKMPKPFEVKITYASGEYTADKTIAEIYTAAENGYEVYALYGMDMFCLAGYSRSSASFINVTNIASSKTSTIRSFVIRSNNTTTYDTKILYNLPPISSPSSVGRIMTVSLAGSENRYSLTTDNTIDDAHTNAKRTYSSQKVDAELSAKANTSDVTASLALKADKATTYTKTEVDTALGNKADTATTYTKSEVDTALALKADEADLPTKTSDLTNDSDYQTGEQVLQSISEAVENKADTDGTYEDMTVGTAMKLVATRHTTDIAPYLFRQSGGDNNAYVGIEETDKLVGASAVVNQMVKNGNFVNTSNWTAINSSLSVANNEATVTVTDTSLASEIRTVVPNRKGHKYFRSAEVKASQGQFIFSWYGAVAVTRNANGNYQTISDIFESPSNDSDNWRLQLGVKADNSPSEFFVKNVILIDITAMFGTAIADYVYSIEQATAGSGIAYLRKYGFFTKSYYPYTANALQSVKTSAHVMMSANRWDEEWEQGTFDNSTGEKKPYSNYWRSKNRIAVLPNTPYYAFTSGDNIYRFYYDANGDYIGSTSGVINQTFTTPNEAYYLNIVDVTRNSYDSSSKPISINYPSTVTTYNPYVKHEYALPNIDLRGLYKLDASNNLYADGDSLTGDGTLTRKSIITDMGNLTWTARGNNVFTSNVLYNAPSINTPFDIVCTGYAVNNVNSATITNYDKVISSFPSYNRRIVMVRDTAYTDTDAFKTAVTGMKLQYELATPTTEQATGFTNPQLVDKYGTEEYTDERNFPMPVGHETDYPLVSEIPMPVPPVTAGTYGFKLDISASGEQTYYWG